MACCLSPLPPCVSDLRRRRLNPQPLHPRRPRWRINLQTMSLMLERRLPVLTRAVAGWRERRTCCQLTAAASQRASRSMCLLSLRRLSRLLVAASNQGSQPPSLGRVLPGCPKPRPPSSSRHHTSPTPRATPTVASTHTSLTLVRRRPAVRRKPLNPGAGHVHVFLPEAFGW